MSLTWRDIRVRYKQSMLGIAWAVLLPLSMMLIFTFVFTRAIDARAALHVDMPYALFAYSGLVPWTFFSASLGGCVTCLVANRNLVTKVYFPREVFPVSCIAGAFVDFCVAMIVLVGLMGYFQWTGAWHFTPSPALAFVPVIILVQVTLTVGLGMMLAMGNLFYRDVRQIFGVAIQLAMFVSAVVVPVIILVQVTLTVGLGMMLAMGNLFYRDVRQIFGVAIQLAMFVSAVVVPVPADGSLLARVIAVNPLVSIIGAYRECILFGRLPAAGGFLYSTVFAAATAVIGVIVFRRASHKFAECI